MNGFQGLLCFLNCFAEIRIKVSYNSLPAGISLPHAVQEEFQVRCEGKVHNAGEALLHDPVYHLAQLRHIEILIFFRDVPSRQDRGDGGSIGTGTSDALLLQSLYQGGLRIMGRRTG